MKLIYPYIQMILNESYFDDLKLTDEDIESSDSINNDEYATPEEWFADMKSRYAHCIEIPLRQKHQWEWNIQLIAKRLFYIFDTYEIKYSEPVLQEIVKTQKYFRNNYFKCNFIDYNGFKLISNFKTLKQVDNSCTNISIVIFFNLPEIRSYKSACVFISHIMRCIQNYKLKDQTYGYFNVWDFDLVIRQFSMDSMTFMNYAASDIEIILKMFFPEKCSTISQELHADNNALLNKLLKCFCSGPATNRSSMR